MNQLSVIIITKNEAANIERCLESIRWADEIIILDSGSTDNTVPICKTYTSNVLSTNWPGFGKQKNRALEKATKDWVLSIDADEWLSDELKNEIQTTLKNPTHNAYNLMRRNFFWGHPLRFGDMGKDPVLRLFKRGTAKFSDDAVHESVKTNETFGTLKAQLMHHTYDSPADLLEKINIFSTTAAQMKHKRGKRVSFAGILLKTAWAFIRAYFIKLGLLDGKIGFIAALSSAQACYSRYLKLNVMNQQHG